MSAHRPHLRSLLMAAAASTTLLLPFAVTAHEGHNKPQHGGQVAEAGAFQGELVVKGRSLVLHVTDYGAPISMAGGSAKATLLAGSDKSELAIVPASGSSRCSSTLLDSFLTPATVKLFGRRPIERLVEQSGSEAF